MYRRPSFKLQLEALEDRLMMSSSPVTLIAPPATSPAQVQTMQPLAVIDTMPGQASSTASTGLTSSFIPMLPPVITTTLKVKMSATDQRIQVVNGSDFPFEIPVKPFFIKVDNEVMKVVSMVRGSPVWKVERGTGAEAHKGGATVTKYFSSTLPASWDESMKELDFNIDQVRTLVEQWKAGKISLKEIADHVTRLVDARISNTNDMMLPNSEQVNGDKDKMYQYDLEAGNFGLGLDRQGGDNYGDDYALRAEWAWNLGFGHCGESASAAYYILKEAGITNLQIVAFDGGVTVGSKPAIGHAFVVVGMDPGANIQDMNTWGENALIVDGWAHNCLTTREAWESPYYGNRGVLEANGQKRVFRLETDKYDNPELYASYQKLVQGPFHCRMEEALAIKRALFAPQGVAVILRPANSAEAGEVFRGKAFVLLGPGFKWQNANQPLGLEVFLRMDGRDVGYFAMPFRKGESAREIVLERDFRIMAPTFLTTKPVTFQIMVREAACKRPVEYLSNRVQVKVVAPLFDLEVRTVDDLTGTPISGVRIGVLRADKVGPVNSGDSAAGSLVFKDLATKEALGPSSSPYAVVQRFRYQVIGGKDGYLGATSAEFTAPPAGEKFVVTLHLVKTANLRVNVVDRLGQPIGDEVFPADASVTLNGTAVKAKIERISPSELLIKDLPVSKDGQALVYDVTVGGLGYADKTVKCNLSKTSAPLTVQLLMAYDPNSNISGSWGSDRSFGGTGYRLNVHVSYVWGPAGEVVSGNVSGSFAMWKTVEYFASDGTSRWVASDQTMSVTGTITPTGAHLDQDIWSAYSAFLSGSPSPSPSPGGLWCSRDGDDSLFFNIWPRSFSIFRVPGTAGPADPPSPPLA